jgi:hypothetical protein
VICLCVCVCVCVCARSCKDTSLKHDATQHATTTSAHNTSRCSQHVHHRETPKMHLRCPYLHLIPLPFLRCLCLSLRGHVTRPMTTRWNVSENLHEQTSRHHHHRLCPRHPLHHLHRTPCQKSALAHAKLECPQNGTSSY